VPAGLAPYIVTDPERLAEALARVTGRAPGLLQRLLGALAARFRALGRTAALALLASRP
jgi:hypothetical protein